METTQELAVITPKDLQHLTELDKEIAGYKEQFKDLVIVDENDKEGYEQVRKAIGVLRPKRTGLEAERKSVVNPYNEVVKFINGKYKEVIETIEAIEQPLKVKKDAIDNIVEQKKEAERLAAEQKINERVNDLIKNGCTFDNSYYSIKDDELGISETSIGVVDIRTMSDELYKNILQTVTDKNAKIVSEKERLQKIKDDAEKERLEKEKQEREEFEKQKEEMRLQQEEMKRQAAELHKQELRHKENIVNDRANQLLGLGMQQYNDYFSISYNGLSEMVGEDSLDKYSNIDWALKIEVIKKTILAIKSLKESDNEKREKQAAIDKVENEKRIAAEAVEKENKRQLEEQQKKQAELDQLGDKEKYEHLVSQIKSLTIPDFKSTQYKGKARIIKDFIADLK